MIPRRPVRVHDARFLFALSLLMLTCLLLANSCNVCEADVGPLLQQWLGDPTEEGSAMRVALGFRQEMAQRQGGLHGSVPAQELFAPRGDCSSACHTTTKAPPVRPPAQMKQAPPAKRPRPLPPPLPRMRRTGGTQQGKTEYVESIESSSEDDIFDRLSRLLRGKRKPPC